MVISTEKEIGMSSFIELSTDTDVAQLKGDTLYFSNL